MKRVIGILITGVLLLASTAHAGLRTEDSITMKKIATPSSNPASGYMKLYFKSDSAIYSLDSAGTEAAAGGGGGGSGDVTAVGDCASGACLSGIAGGGTTFALYDGDSNKGTFVTANLNADRIYTFGNLALTFDQSVASGASPTFTGTNITAVASVTVADAGGDTTTFPMLSADATGTKAVLTDAGLTYQATTNALTATTFIGALTGNSSTATALAADPANCASSGLAGGVTAAGVAEGCVTPGTGVTTAMAVNVGSTGAFVVNGGALGTPSSGVATNLTGTASGLTAGTVITNANLTGEVTSSGNAATIADSITVTGWVMGASTATTPSTNDDDNSLATTAFVNAEILSKKAYDEFDLSPAGMTLDDGSPPDLTIVESTGTGTARRLVADFDPTTDQFGYWTFTVPSDAGSGNILLDVNWFTNDTGANEDAIWYAQISCSSEGDADSMTEDAAGSANTASEDCNATEANRPISTTITLSNTDSYAPGDVCTLVFGRDADDSIGNADNDGLSSDARLVNVHVKIPRA